MENYKTIQDTVHGSVRVERMALDLLASPELQRLAGIRQLGLGHMIFPGANHSRLEHSMGVYYIASKLATALGLPEEERKLVAAAGLLHDVGHGPYSHSLEEVLHNKMGIDHMALTKRIITGDYDIIPDWKEGMFPRISIDSVLNSHGLEPSQVAELITGSDQGDFTLDLYSSKKGEQTFFHDKEYLSQIIHGAIDVDQIDYLLRDAHYSGVSHGIIDVDRLVQTLTIHHNDLVVHKKGVSAVEGMLVARGLMYSSVYFHKTGRICQLMLARAVERTEYDPDQFEVQKMNDAELMGWLMSQQGYASEMALRLKYRRLFKSVRAWTLEEIEHLEDGQRQKLLELADFDKRGQIEDKIALKAGVPEGSVIVDLPLPGLLLCEPRIAQTGIKVLDEDRLLPLARYSPLANALQRRNVSSWVVMVATPREHMDKVRKVSEKILFE